MNEDRVDDVMVIHKIPIMASHGGVTPVLGLSILAGVCDNTTRGWAYRHFAEARLREAVEASAKRDGVAVSPPED
jgi:hypothetical protein